MTRSLSPPGIKTEAPVPMPSAARAFCEGHGILPFLGSVAELVGGSFDLAEPLTFSAACDPESGEEWLEIAATARGTVREIRDAYRDFTTHWLASVPPLVQERVRLVLLAE